MGSDIIPGTDGTVRFPTERRMEATLLDVRMLAPREDLALAMADEIAQTQGHRHWIDVGGAPDVRTQTAEAFLALFGALEFGMGREAALASLRKLVAVQVEQAHALCQAYQDAEAEAEDAQARLRAARVAGAAVPGGSTRANAPHLAAGAPKRFRRLPPSSCFPALDAEVDRTRALWTERTLAAHAATAAALGARTALDVVEQGTSWRHVPRGEEDDWLCSVAELRERRRQPHERPPESS